MKRLWIILSSLVLLSCEDVEEKTIADPVAAILLLEAKDHSEWLNSLNEGTFIEGENTRIIKKQENGNVTIQLSGPEYITIWEYDKTGRMISIGCCRTVREFIPFPKEAVIEL